MQLPELRRLNLMRWNVPYLMSRFPLGERQWLCSQTRDEKEDNWRETPVEPIGQDSGPWTGTTCFKILRTLHEQDTIVEEDTHTIYMNQIRLIHRNLGHPNHQVMRRMFKDAGASPAVLKQVDRFRCDHCLQRGRRATCQPATPPPIRDKWECASVDSFWWHVPKELLSPGQEGQHVVGISCSTRPRNITRLLWLDKEDNLSMAFPGKSSKRVFWKVGSNVFRFHKSYGTTTKDI